MEIYIKKKNEENNVFIMGLERGMWIIKKDNDVVYKGDNREFVKKVFDNLTWIYDCV